MSRSRSSSRHRAPWALVLCLLASGCSSLSPRDAEPPEGDVELITLSEIERTFEQINIGLEAGNVQQYINAFDQTDYVFTPGVDDLSVLNAEGNSVFDEEWDYTQEEFVAQFTFGAHDFLIASFEPCDDGCDGSVTADVDDRFWFYQLRAVATGAADTTRYFGLANIEITRKAGEWRITRWEDERDPSNPADPAWGCSGDEAHRDPREPTRSDPCMWTGGVPGDLGRTPLTQPEAPPQCLLWAVRHVRGIIRIWM